MTYYEMYEVAQIGLTLEIVYFNLYAIDIFTNPSPVNSSYVFMLSGLVYLNSIITKR